MAKQPLLPVELDDHDQRLKVLVMEFLDALFRLFWPEFAGFFDFRRVEWLDKEAYPDPPTGKRKILDLVAKLRLRKRLEIRPGVFTDHLLAIVLIEIESSDSTVSSRKDLFKYFAWLRQKFDLMILPAALFLNVAHDGIGVATYEENFGSLEVLRYKFLYVGLPGLDGQEYLEGDNLLGVALSALMKVPPEEQARHRALALKRIVRSDESDFHKFLLAECVQAYQPLQGDQADDLQSLLQTQEFREVKKMAVTWFDKGVEKGLEQGLKQGRVEGIELGYREFACAILEERFGALPKRIRELLNKCDVEELKGIVQRSHRVKKIGDLFES